MPLNAEQRVAFLAHAAEHAASPDSEGWASFLREHRGAILDELGAVPGISQVRAVALRALPELVQPGPEREALLTQAGAALAEAPEGDPTAQLARHPAWIGLGLLEFAALRPDFEGDPVERAVELAGRAFSVVGGAADLDEGEILWAMAEQAGDIGWMARSDELLERALEASFADPAHRAQVRLLVAMRMEQREASPRSLLALVAEDEQALDRDRVHAAWILAHLRREAADPDGALEVLQLAADLVDRQNDPQVASKIDATLQDWSAS